MPPAVSLNVKLWTIIIKPVKALNNAKFHDNFQVYLGQTVHLSEPLISTSVQLGISLWLFNIHMLKTNSFSDTILDTVNACDKEQRQGPCTHGY